LLLLLFDFKSTVKNHTAAALATADVLAIFKNTTLNATAAVV